MEEGDASRLARAVLSQVQSQHSRTRWRKHLNMFLFLILMGFYLSSEASRLRSINPEKPPSPSQMTNKQLPKRYQYLGSIPFRLLPPPRTQSQKFVSKNLVLESIVECSSPENLITGYSTSDHQCWRCPSSKQL